LFAQRGKRREPPLSSVRALALSLLSLPAHTHTTHTLSIWCFHWPSADVEMMRLAPTASSTAIRPAHAMSPFVPSLYVSPDSDQVSGV